MNNERDMFEIAYLVKYNWICSKNAIKDSRFPNLELRCWSKDNMRVRGYDTKQFTREEALQAEEKFHK